MSQNAVESSVRERNKRRWVFEDDEPMAYQESKQIPERPGECVCTGSKCTGVCVCACVY